MADTSTHYDAGLQSFVHTVLKEVQNSGNLSTIGISACFTPGAKPYPDGVGL